ncbi:MAG: type II secretion system protein GspH [Sinobacteraceae bacterium]|nr:type II secretion system protein GspH [Nevskiaceae bacterium]
MLVVITIIGLMIGGAVLALGVVGRDRSLEEAANRLRATLDYARDRAELETRHYGLRVTREGYAFAWFDPRAGVWQPALDDALRPRQLPEGLSLEAWIEGRRIVLDADADEEAAPQLGIDSNGEFTPFELLLRRDAETYVQRIRPDENGELELLTEGTAP